MQNNSTTVGLDWDGIHRRPLTDRFWAHVKRGGTEDCWEWLASKTPTGYGKMKTSELGGQFAYAHRVSWFLAHGTILDGMLVCHHCDNPACVNPSHLFLGTTTDNVADRHLKGRSRGPSMPKRGGANVKAKLTETSVRDARSRYAEGGETMKQLADQHGVTESTIQRVIHRHTWRHVV